MPPSSPPVARHSQPLLTHLLPPSSPAPAFIASSHHRVLCPPGAPVTPGSVLPWGKRPPWGCAASLMPLGANSFWTPFSHRTLPGGAGPASGSQHIQRKMGWCLTTGCDILLILKLTFVTLAPLLPSNCQGNAWNPTHLVLGGGLQSSGEFGDSFFFRWRCVYAQVSLT